MMELDSEAAQIRKNQEKAGLAEHLTEGFKSLVRQFKSENKWRKLAHERPLFKTAFIQSAAFEFLFKKESLRDLGLPKELGGEDLKELSAFVDYLHKNYPEALTLWVEKTNGDSAVEDPRIIIISQLAQKVLENGA